MLADDPIEGKGLEERGASFQQAAGGFGACADSRAAWKIQMETPAIYAVPGKWQVFFREMRYAFSF